MLKTVEKKQHKKKKEQWVNSSCGLSHSALRGNELTWEYGRMAACMDCRQRTLPPSLSTNHHQSFFFFLQCCWYGVLHYAIVLPLPSSENQHIPSLTSLSLPLSPSLPPSLVLILMTQLSEAAAVPLRSFPPADCTHTHAHTLLHQIRYWTHIHTLTRDICRHTHMHTHTKTLLYTPSSYQRQPQTLSLYTHLFKNLTEGWGRLDFAFVLVCCLQAPYYSESARQQTFLVTLTSDGTLEDPTIWDLSLVLPLLALSNLDLWASVGALGQRTGRTALTRSLCLPSPSSCPSSSGCWRRRWRSCRAWRR